MSKYTKPRKSSSGKTLAQTLRKFSTLSLSLLEDRSVPSITGTVFEDYNANGVMDTSGSIALAGGGTQATAVDNGVPGITVTAYDANNNVAATATTDANGNYSLNPASNGSFRIEFTSLPNGVYFGPSGTSSGSAVQFVSSNSAINVDLGVVRPEDFSPDNPTLVTSEYVVGGSSSTDLNNGAPVVVSFPETSGASESDPTRSDHQDPSKTDLASQTEVGATWGLSYDATTNELYAAAFMKRTTGFGPGGSGAIYQINPTTNATSVYVDLNSIFSDYPGGNFNDLYTDINGNPVTLRTNTSSPTYWFTDGLEEVTDSTGVVRDVGWDAVGKTGFGGIATSADGSTIYAMALGDRMLYAIPTSGALNTTTIQRFSLPVPTDVTGVTAANPDGDLQPFAVTEYRGIVYIGAVNSAESTQNAADLNAYIFAFNPATGRFIDSTGKPTTTKPVFEFNLNYPRGYTQQGGDPDPNYPSGYTPPDPAAWNPWSPVAMAVEAEPNSLGRSDYAQPELTGLSFDSQGNLTIGLRDRSGDQIGRNVPLFVNDPTNYSYFSMTAGDTLRASINTPYSLDSLQAGATTSFSGWTLESNGRVDGQGNGPVSDGEGPGGAEFFYQQDFPRDPSTTPVGLTDENEYVSDGGVLQIPGTSQSLVTSFDPVRQVGDVNGGGVRDYSNTTGALNSSYELYVTPSNSGNSTFAKGNGIGDLVAVTGTAPIEIGNYVWNDTNGNGIQDAGEAGVGNVVVDLYSAGPDGVFGDADDVLIAAATTDASGNYYFSSGSGTSTANHIFGLPLVADSDYQVRVNPNQTSLNGLVFTTQTADATANGTQRDSNVNSLGIANVTTGVAGSADDSIDIGLKPAPNLAIGNFVWNDINNDGVYESGEPGLPNVEVELVTASGTLVATTTTNAGGGYLFTHLSPGEYRVEIVTSTLPSTSLISSTGANSISSGPFEPAPGTTGDSTDHGTAVGSVVEGPIVDLNYGTQPLGETPTPGGIVNPSSDADSDLTQDFGFFQTLTIGNQVWFDANNNGIFDKGETGTAGVTVDLLNSTGSVIATTTTASDGTYYFTGLFSGTYSVTIIPPTGYISSTGTLGSLKGPFEPAPYNTIDSEDKGTQAGSVITSPSFKLGLPGSTLNPSLNGFGNLTLDFGLINQNIVVPPPPPPPEILPASVSGYVFRDIVTYDGIQETGETGIAGVTVTLTNGTITETTTTDKNGFYDFINLQAGAYTIVETHPQGFYDGIDTPGSLGGTNPKQDVLTVSLAAGDAGVEYNFAEVLPASVYGYVFYDSNDNHLLDSGDPIIPGVTVKISGTAFAGTPVARPLTAADSLGGLTSITDASGRYLFPDLPPGTYTITETEPAGYIDYFAVDQEPTKLGSVVVGVNTFSTVSLADSQHRGPLNFGAILPQQPSKTDFLGSTGSGVTVPPSSGAALNIPTNLPLDPTYTVSTGTPDSPAFVVVAAGAGYEPLVRVFNYATGVEEFRFYAYEQSYTGGVRVAVADVNGDGVPDIITATGIGGGPRVRVFSGVDGSVIRDFFAYESTFRGGVFVAGGDVNGDGMADIITGTDLGGGPRVTVFSGATGKTLQDFFAFPSTQRGGVRVAVADFNGDGKADIVTTAGAGVETEIRVFNGATHAVISDFTPYTASYTGGVFVAAGDVNGDGVPDIVTGSDVGGGPEVQVFSGLTGKSIDAFYAADSSYRGGIRVAVQDVEGNGKDQIITGTGDGGPATISIWNVGDPKPVEQFYGIDTTFTGGVYVG